MPEIIYCQSCGMPMDKEELFGSNQDGSKNEDYCVYCYKSGSFTEDVTMQEMIEISLMHMKELFEDDENYNAQEAEAQMQKFFPTLKRWQV